MSTMADQAPASAPAVHGLHHRLGQPRGVRASGAYHRLTRVLWGALGGISDSAAGTRGNAGERSMTFYDR